MYSYMLFTTVITFGSNFSICATSSINNNGAQIKI